MPYPSIMTLIELAIEFREHIQRERDCLYSEREEIDVSNGDRRHEIQLKLFVLGQDLKIVVESIATAQDHHHKVCLGCKAMFETTQPRYAFCSIKCANDYLALPFDWYPKLGT